MELLEVWGDINQYIAVVCDAHASRVTSAVRLSAQWLRFLSCRSRVTGLCCFNVEANTLRVPDWTDSIKTCRLSYSIVHHVMHYIIFHLLLRKSETNQFMLLVYQWKSGRSIFHYFIFILEKIFVKELRDIRVNTSLICKDLNYLNFS